MKKILLVCVALLSSPVYANGLGEDRGWSFREDTLEDMTNLLTLRELKKSGWPGGSGGGAGGGPSNTSVGSIINNNTTINIDGDDNTIGDTGVLDNVRQEVRDSTVGTGVPTELNGTLE